MNPGPWGILIIAIVVLLLFGRGKISTMMGEVAGGIKAFRKGMAEEEKTAEIEAPRQAQPTYAEPVRETERKDA